VSDGIRSAREAQGAARGNRYLVPLFPTPVYSFRFSLPS
jgi:hypothetical protein